MLLIEKRQIKNWLDELKKKFKVIDIKKSVLSPKQYFFPPREETFVFNKRTGKLKTVKAQPKKFIVFGLDLEDLEAMTQLDEIMKKPKPDFFYWQRREKAILIGLSDKSVEVFPGGDLVLEKINKKQYRVLALNIKGDRLTKSNFFKEKHVSNKDIKKYPKKLCDFKKLLLDAELLKDAVKWSRNHKIWDELAERCLGCGNCTYVCPICHCFSTEDKVALDKKTCSRCRYWDACTLPEFAQIAGGHNFHKSIKERYYNWFYHKFVRAYHEYGKSQCVDCGRCHKYCPAGIDIEKVIIEIVGDYQKAMPN